MKLLSFHLTGNANVKAALNGFAAADILGEFHVAIASTPGSALDKISSIPALSEIKRRRFDALLKPFLHTWPWYELGRILALKANFKKLTHPVTAPFSIDTVVKNIDRHVARGLLSSKKKGITAVYGYEDTTLFAFKKAKELGLKCYYDLPIGYWRSAHKLLATEQQRWPEWMSTMPGLDDSKEKLDRKDNELLLADKILVASTFTANTLIDFPGKLAPVHVIPYGFPSVNDTDRDYENFNTNRPLKLLFVGSLSQRKGIADLFEAVKNIGKQVELTIVGTKTTDDCLPLNEALTRHRWIPSIPHDEVLQLMRENDILVFPSLFEGFGLVITEAMSQGTPVITTDRTAGPDLIKHGINGWLIKAGSTIALENAIKEVLLNPQNIATVGKAAMETARLRPWKTYGQELANKLQEQDSANI